MSVLAMLTPMFQKLITTGVACLVLVSLVAGCTSKKKDPPNTVHLSISAKLKGLDPVNADDMYSGIQSSHAYEGLLQYHYLKRPYVLTPNLAESMPEVSADGKTLTIKIKKGVLFQDDPCFKATGGKGREFEASDIVYSWKRLADPKLTSSGWWVFDGKIVGLNEWHDESAKAGTSDYAKPVEGLKILDRYTLQVKLTQRSAQILYALAMPFTFVVPHEGPEMYGQEYINHAVGTGAFKLQEYDPNSKVVWVRNPTYRKELFPSEGEAKDKESGLLEDAGKPLPLTDKLVYQILVESQPAWLSFLAGKLDLSPIPKDNYSQAIGSNKQLNPELAAKGIKFAKEPQLDITHTSFNMTDPLVGKNKLLRQALSIGYDDVQYIETFYNGQALAAQGPIPPGITGYDLAFKNSYRVYDVAKAKDLLAKAGFPEGKGLPPLEYITLADSTSRQSTEYMQKMMSAIGVQLKVSTYSWPEFQASVKNKKGQMWSFAWGADYPDAENFLQLFYGKNGSPGPNDSNYLNPEFDKLYEKALLLQDSPERTAIYQQMVKIVVEDCPWIFGSHRLNMALTYPWLKNFKYHEFDHAKAKYYRVDPLLKK